MQKIVSRGVNCIVESHKLRTDISHTTKSGHVLISNLYWIFEFIHVSRYQIHMGLVTGIVISDRHLLRRQ